MMGEFVNDHSERDDTARYRLLVKEMLGESLEERLNYGEEETIYINRLRRFKSNKYSPSNAAALDEICFNVSRASGAGNKNLAPPPGFDVSIPICGIEPVTGEEEVFAYIFVSCKLDMVVLSFTGTETLGQLLSDLIFIPVPPSELNGFRRGMLVERGFYEIYLAVQTEIRSKIKQLVKEKMQFVVTGHSLGGALATLGSFDLGSFCPIVYTFASPRVGNSAFAQGYNLLLQPVWRVANSSDIVPDVPLPVFLIFIYEHVGNPVVFTLNLGRILDNHIEAYRRVIIERQFPDNPNGICPSRFDCSSKECDCQFPH